MAYEVVNPSMRDKRGPFFHTFASAMSHASDTLEVWEVASDLHHARQVKRWPNDTAGGELAAGAAAVAQRARRAEREAAAIIAESELDGIPTTYEVYLAVVSLAWATGRLSGFKEGSERVLHALETARTPTTEGN